MSGRFLIGTPKYQKIITVCLFLFISILLFGRAFAHGGGNEQITLEKNGPYQITVWSESGSGDLHFTISVSDLSNRFILDADVLIDVVALDAGRFKLTKEATTTQSANKFHYETDFSAMKPGNYLITVTVNGYEGKGVTGFEMEHIYRRDIPWGNLVFLLSIIVLGLFSFLYRSKI
jgi:hypothetical protein